MPHAAPSATVMGDRIALIHSLQPGILHNQLKRRLKQITLKATFQMIMIIPKRRLNQITLTATFQVIQMMVLVSKNPILDYLGECE